MKKSPFRSVLNNLPRPPFTILDNLSSIRRVQSFQSVEEDSYLDKINTVTMGSKLMNVRGGDIGEYAANLILSKIAFTTFIPRQEDFGLDFFCGLMKESSGKLYFDKAFTLQVKTSRDPITFGTLPAKKGEQFRRWDQESINALFQLNIPYFIAHVDPDKLHMDIYSTSQIWLIAREYQDTSAIEFRFPADPNYRRNNEIHLHKNRKKLSNWPTTGAGDGYKYIIDLCNPVLHITSKHLADKNKIQKYRRILSKLIIVEQKNILYNYSKLPYFKWLHKYKTNSEEMRIGWLIYDNETHINKPLEFINEIPEHLISLAVGLKEHSHLEEYEALCKVIKLLSNDKLKEFKALVAKYPELAK